MPSPFPGMDPYLEGYLWPDVHHRLATEISRQLMPQLRPRYVARIEIQVVQDSTPEAEIGIMYPDVEVVKSRSGGVESAETQPNGGARVAAAATITAPLTIPVLKPVEVRLSRVEIRDAAQNQLVTSIEILSPVNKREPELTTYRQKRYRLYQAGVHLLELDFLRRGTRPLVHPRLPDVPYLVSLTRASSAMTEVWPIKLPDPLPLVPVPLRPPDADVTLNLASVMTTIYDEAAYDLSVDYSQSPPPPPLSPAEATWLEELLRAE
jgi:hypothetical protein